MTEHTPEKVTDLIAEARKTADRIRNVIGPSDRYADMIDRLSDALEHKITWEDADTIARADYRLQLSAAVNRYASAEAERDEALAVIAEVRKLPRYSAFEGDRVWSAVDADDLHVILSRIPEHPKED